MITMISHIPKTHLEKHAGLSLIEVMIALVISMILTAGAVQIFMSNKAVYRLENALSRIQESGRMVVDAIAKEVRMSGFSGCASRGDMPMNVMADDPPPITINADNAFRGFDDDDGDGIWSPNLPPEMLAGMTDIDGDNSRDVIPGTDVIIVQRADQCSASIVGNWDVSNANAKVHYPNECGFEQDQVVAVTDCRTMDIFAVGNAPSNSGNEQTLNHSTNNNTGNFLGSTYGPDSQIHTFRSIIFFIAPGESGDPALHMAIWKSSNSDGNVTAADYTTLELADGVADMQLLFGVDNAGGDDYADNYVTADNVTDWADVRSARVGLLMQSDDNITDEPRNFQFNGTNANTANDRRLRMVFSTTVALRNRLQ